VRINLRMAEMNDTASKNLGLTWNFCSAGGSTTTVAEIPVSNLANLLSGSPSATSQQLVGNKGLQFGSFFHTPVSFSTVFQAQEFLRLQLPAIQWQLLPRGLDP